MGDRKKNWEKKTGGKVQIVETKNANITDGFLVWLFQPETLLLPTKETEEFSEFVEPLTPTPLSPRFPPHTLMNLSPPHVTSPSTWAMTSVYFLGYEKVTLEI